MEARNASPKPRGESANPTGALPTTRPRFQPIRWSPPCKSRRGRGVLASTARPRLFSQGLIFVQLWRERATRPIGRQRVEEQLLVGRNLGATDDAGRLVIDDADGQK